MSIRTESLLLASMLLPLAAYNMIIDWRLMLPHGAEQFGVSYGMIRELVLGGFINRDLLDLKFV